MLGSAFFERSNKFDAFGILFAAGILFQTFRIACLNLYTRRILQGFHSLGVACRDLMSRERERAGEREHKTTSFLWHAFEK